MSHTITEKNLQTALQTVAVYGGFAENPWNALMLQNAFYLGKFYLDGNTALFMPYCSYSAVELARFTGSIDFNSSSMNYLYHQAINAEAFLLIPAPVFFRGNWEEMLMPFERWQASKFELQCPALLFGLSILFLYQCLVITKMEQKWDKIIQAVCSPYPLWYRIQQMCKEFRTWEKI